MGDDCDSSLDDLLALAFELAEIADAIAIKRFRSDQLVVVDKPDGSPVTNADQEIERAIRARIRDQRPGDAILGEELGSTGSSAYRWYLDPIDGTSEYIAGGQHWRSLITLARGDQLQLALASAPAAGSRWWAARGRGAFRDTQRLHVSATGELASATITDDWRRTLARGLDDHPLARLAALCAHVRPHRGHRFLEVAAGEVDLALNAAGFIWDYAPMKLIVTEAGGRFTKLDGRTEPGGGDALVTNGALHQQALAVIVGPD